MKVLDIGCGPKKTEGAIGLDKVKLPGVDVVWDLEKFSYPFSDNEFDKIVSNHCIEHIENFVGLMEEIYRIAKPGAEIIFVVPYYTSKDFFTDFTHKHAFTEHTFQYFDDNHIYGYYSKARFKVKRIKFNYSAIGRWVPIRRILRHYLWNFVDSLEFNLEAVKEKKVKK